MSLFHYFGCPQGAFHCLPEVCHPEWSASVGPVQMSSQHSTLFWPGRGGRERKAKKQASLVTCGGASLLWLTFSTLSRIWPMQFLPVALNTFLEMRWSFKLIQSLLSKLRNYFDSFFWAAFISYYPLSFLPAEVIPFFGEKKKWFLWSVFVSMRIFSRVSSSTDAT